MRCFVRSESRSARIWRVGKVHRHQDAARDVGLIEVELLEQRAEEGCGRECRAQGRGLGAQNAVLDGVVGRGFDLRGGLCGVGFEAWLFGTVGTFEIQGSLHFASLRSR